MPTIIERGAAERGTAALRGNRREREPPRRLALSYYYPVVHFTPSRFTILTPLRGGRALAFNTFSGALAVLEAEEVAAYERVGAPGFPSEDLPIRQELAYAGFIVADEVDELASLRRIYEAHRFDERALILTVAPTMACNFGCDYCFQGQGKPNEGMGPEIQDAVVRLIERATPGLERVHVAWYGGEPLLRRDIIAALSQRMIAHCDARGLTYEAAIVTNGYFLDAETARALVAGRVMTAQVTLDGPPSHHDLRRHLHSRKGTFARIIDNLRAVVDEVPELRLSVRVNIDERNGDDIRGLLEILAEAGFGGRHNFKIYFAPVEAMTEGCHNVEDVTLGKSKYAELETELYRHGYSAGLTSLPYPPRFHGTCAAIRPSGFVVVPSGLVHKCWDTVSQPERAIGDVRDLDGLARSPIAQAWLAWTPFRNETCTNCKILPTCAGACAYKFVHAGSQRGEAAILPCPSWKYNIRERLLLRAVASGALSKDDFDAERVRTISTELCADVHVDGGQALPDEMLALLGRSQRSLPVLQS